MDTDGRSVDEIADTVPGPWGRPREPVNVGDRIARPLTPAPRPLIPPPFPSPEEPGAGKEVGPRNPVDQTDGMTRQAAPPTPLELLGLPANARVLLLNCDDLGMYHAVNVGVIEAIEQGIATSCSLMPPCPWAGHALALLRQRPEIPCGVHLTLVNDTAHYRWGPLSDRGGVPSLVDASGRFLSGSDRSTLLARARLDEVEREFRAQLREVLDGGVSPTHLDWHCLADGGREDIFELTVALAEEHGLAVRVWGEPARRAALKRGRPVVDHPFLDSFSLALDGKLEHFAALLRALPSGLTEWAVHPGLVSEEARAADPDGWRVRATDHAFLTSPAARDIVREEGVTLIDYRDIQRGWAS